MILGIQIVFHTIYIYEQKFNTVQTATANNPLGPAEGQFCMSVCTCSLHRMIGTFLYTNDQCVCSLTCKYWEQFFQFSHLKRPEHTQDIQ